MFAQPATLLSLLFIGNAFCIVPHMVLMSTQPIRCKPAQQSA